jgi:hypothetical protein
MYIYVCMYACIILHHLFKIYGINKNGINVVSYLFIIINLYIYIYIYIYVIYETYNIDFNI